MQRAWILPLIVLWGISADAKVVDRILAQVNDDIITLSDLNREMVEIRQELAGKYAGPQLDEEVKKAEKQVLDNLIRQKLLLQKANEYGFGANVDLEVRNLNAPLRPKG
jgi:peptidyl-prolyl cis-trans isomerase SurA